MEGPPALTISIRISKTNQTGPPTSIRIPASYDPSYCCFNAIKQYLSLRPQGSHYFFTHQNGSPLTRSQFSGVLTKSVRTLGLPTQIYTSHSFRIGRASDLASRGVPVEVIKKLGRWKSLAVERYIRL
ncbi:MAG: tyrosine-type recombinase/integrase [Candidatus Thiodiazotropha sp.]